MAKAQPESFPHFDAPSMPPPPFQSTQEPPPVYAAIPTPVAFPKLAIVSNKLLESGLLLQSALSNTRVVLYDFDRGNFRQIIDGARQAAGPAGKFESICFLDHGFRYEFVLLPQYKFHLGTMLALNARPEVQQFWRELGQLVAPGPGARIEILTCDLGLSPEGLAWLNDISALSGVPCYAQDDVTDHVAKNGAWTTSIVNNPAVASMSQYFATEQFRHWVWDAYRRDKGYKEKRKEEAS